MPFIKEQKHEYEADPLRREPTTQQDRPLVPVPILFCVTKRNIERKGYPKRKKEESILKSAPKF